MGVPPLVTAHGSRDKLPSNSHHEASSARLQPSLGSDVFSTPDADVQGAHLILISLPELDPVNPLTPMVNQVKILLDVAQIQVA